MKNKTNINIPSTIHKSKDNKNDKVSKYIKKNAFGITNSPRRKLAADSFDLSVKMKNMFSPKYLSGAPKLAKFEMDGGIEKEDLSLGDCH